jgi:hypothetical protein
VLSAVRHGGASPAAEAAAATAMATLSAVPPPVPTEDQDAADPILLDPVPDQGTDDRRLARDRAARGRIGEAPAEGDGLFQVACVGGLPRRSALGAGAGDDSIPTQARLCRRAGEIMAYIP